MAFPTDPSPIAPAAPAPRTFALGRRLFRLLFAAVLLPAALVGVLQTVYEYRAVEHRQQDRLRLAVRLTAISIDQFVQSHASAVALTARTASVDGASPDLADLKLLFPAFTTALATDRDGLVVAVEPVARRTASAMASVADRDYFRVPAAEGGIYVSNAFRGRGLGSEPLVAVSAPMVENGAFAGVVEGSINVERFTSLRSNALRQRGQEMLLVDRDGHVIHASAGLPFQFRQAVGDRPFLRGQELLDGVSASRLDTGTLDGPTWVAWSQLRSGWRVALFERREAALAPVWQHARQTAVLLGLATLIVLVLASMQMGRLAGVLRITLERVRAIAAGDVTPDIPLDDLPAELRPLAVQVVQLAGQLQRANAGLQQALLDQQALTGDLRGANDRLEETVRARTAELERANRELEHLSQTDSLTGALNVRGLTARYERSTARDGRLDGDAAVVMFDVDVFKHYNDRYGHPAGDQVLRRVTASALAALRGDADCVARVGGEEFVVFLPGASAEAARDVAERIRQDIRALGIPHADGRDGRVTVSLGVAAGRRGDRIDDVVRVADAALYASKSAGRNRVSG